MKAAYEKVRAIEKQIAEAETELSNVDNWITFSHEKTERKAKLSHWIGELKEARLKALNTLKTAVETEINKNL